VSTEPTGESYEDDWDYFAGDDEPVSVGIEATPEEIEGTVVRVSPQFWGDWGWAELSTGNNRMRSKPMKFTGNIKGIVDVGARVILRGVWEENEKYGRSFRADLVAPAEVTGRDGVLSWLALNLPQIDVSRSAELYDRFGDSLWDVLATEPARITEVRGITSERALEIQAAYLKYQDSLQTHLKLYSLGLSQLEILRVFKTKEKVDPDAIKVDPFLLYLKHGMTFARVEKIVAAKGLGRGSNCGASYPAAAASEAVRRLCF